MRNESSTNHSDANFETVATPLADRTWMSGDEFFAEMRNEWDEESEGSEAPSIPDPRLLGLRSPQGRTETDEGWTPIHTNAEVATPGEIWTTKATVNTPNPKLVVIYRTDVLEEQPEGNPLYEVLPISFQHQFAAQHDLLVERDESPLGIGFMVETHFPITILSESLDACIGELTEQMLNETRLLVLDAFGLLWGDENTDAREAVRRIPQGHLITRRDDIRLQFREHERENVAYLVNPANAVLAEMNRVEDAQRASSLTVQPRQPWTLVVREWGEKKLAAARTFGEKVFEEVVGAGVDWMTAVTNVPSVQPQYGGTEDEEATAWSEARERFSDGEGTSVYPPENVADVVEGCFFRVLCIETGYYLRIRVLNAGIPLELGVLEIDDEPIFESGLFPGKPNLATGLVYRLPIENETVAHEVILPFARNGKEDIVRFRIEPMSLVLNAKPIETNAGDE